MRRQLVTIAAATAISIGMMAPATAVAPDQAATYMGRMAERAIAALASEQDPFGKFNRLLYEGVDFELISKQALGRRASAAQLREIGRLLAAKVTAVAAEHLGQGRVTGFRIGQSTPLPNGHVLVQAVIVGTGAKPIHTGWRVAEEDGRLRVVDVEFEGYSMRIHYQNEFERRIRFGGIDGLIKSLRRDIKTGA